MPTKHKRTRPPSSSLFAISHNNGGRDRVRGPMSDDMDVGVANETYLMPVPTDDAKTRSWNSVHCAGTYTRFMTRH
ncbi:uncharacterized protein ARMOST_19136 [Armillaria ostoyae]|uniref:Uncharacterized protein n=1 Tax=Armillaria ostoyae TaxID=47428 RepID=A0A284S3P7_ARMOS|nr:uncharacterized protein ARMOST_19136 [Armillaria ostoyae]